MSLFTDELARLDAYALEQVQALHWAPLSALFVLASAWWVKGLLFVGIGVLRDSRSRPLLPLAAISGVLAFGLASAATSLVKDLVDRPRPALADPTFEALVATPESASFPSGHASTAFAAAVAVAVFCPRRLRWPLLGLATLVALSRVYLGVHYWLDVLVGSALGIGAGLLAARLVRRGAIALRPSASAEGDA